MQQSNRDILKEYFKSKKIPTGEQFAELIDSVPNIVEDGYIQSGENGLILSPHGEKNTLLNVHSEEIETDSIQKPCWSLILDDDNQLQLINAEGATLFSTAVKKQEDTQKMEFKVHADRRWHTLPIEDGEISQRFGCRAYRIVAFYKHPRSGNYRFTEAIVSHRNGRKLEIISASKSYGIWFSRIKFRWKVVNRDIYIQVKCRRKISDNKEIQCHIFKLWECIDEG